ncbi:MAG: hypothetical protein ACTSVE_09125 [Candidatus Helarchaeota archaeon]
MLNIEKLENNLKKDVEELINAIKKERIERESSLIKHEEEIEKLKKRDEIKINELKNENERLNLMINTLETRLKTSINIEDRISEFLKSITELKKISGEAMNITALIFKRLIDEELKVILKMSDSFAMRKNKSQIDRQSLDYALRQFINSDRLLKKTIELVHKIHF